MKKGLLGVVWTAPLLGVAALFLCLFACFAGWFDRIKKARSG
jgi:hypothetical protein